MRVAWRLKSTKFKTILFKSLLIILGYAKCFDAFIILKFNRCFRGAILDKTENLHNKQRIFYKAAVSTDILTHSLSFTDVAFVLHFNEVYLNNYSTKFDYMSY